MEEKFVINIGRQLGSGGRAVGEILARRLGVRLYDRELINLAARESGLCPDCFERNDEQRTHSLFTTLMGYLRTPFAGCEGEAGTVLSNEALFKIQSDVIRAVAERESAIFVGRCADYILRDHPRTLNLFLSAPEEARIGRICSRAGCSEEEARRRCTQGDERRRAYYNYYTGRRWGRAATYDLALDTSILGDEATAEVILDFAARKLNVKF